MTIRELTRWALAQAGRDKRFEIDLLLCHVLQVSRAYLMAHDDAVPTQAQEERFRRLLERYAAREPLQYLLGTANFMGLELTVTPAVLIPRFDTERLVEQVLARLEGRTAPAVVDVCTGSGAIAIAVSRQRPDAQVWAVDLSREALAVAEQNNRQCGTQVQFVRGDLLRPVMELPQRWDVIVSNPPYITSQEMTQLPEDVQQEPVLALWGGADGLYFYRKLTRDALALLKPGGWLCFEIGSLQGAAVFQLMTEAGLHRVTVVQDWQGLDRVVCGQLPESP